MTQVTDPTGAYSFTYDNLGRLLGAGTQYSFLSTPLNNTYSYDAASNRVSFSNPQSQITNYSYDSLNRLTTLTYPNTGQFGFGYDALGRRTSLTRPNGVSTSYSYDTLSRLLSVLDNGGSLPGSTGYTYDAAGNRTSKTAVQQASPNPVSVTSNYSYDAIYELTQAVVGGTLAESYSYDPVGNKLTSAGPISYSYNAPNELTSTSAATYTYDNNGNTTSKTDSTGTTYYTWDFENRLSSVTLPGTGGTISFKYDPLGRRIEKASSAGTTVYAYDGDNITEELGGGGNLLAHYTQGSGIDEPLATTGTWGTYFYHADGLGSITSLTDGSGQLAADYVYDSFGKLTASTGTITNPFRYTGREFDSETGLYYYRARYYNPQTGDFINEDPVVAGGINAYSFVENRPTSLIDPAGLGPSQHSREPGMDAIARTLNLIKFLLPDDPQCKKFLCSKNVDPLSTLDNILKYRLFGMTPIQPTKNADGSFSMTNAASGMIPNQAITVNSIGGFFSSSYNGLPLSTNNGRITGGTAAAQGFILLHELGHNTNVLEDDLNDRKAGERNNILIQKECKKTIKALGAK